MPYEDGAARDPQHCPGSCDHQEKFEEIGPLVAKELPAVGEGVLGQTGPLKDDGRRPDEGRGKYQRYKRKQQAGQSPPKEKPAQVTGKPGQKRRRRKDISGLGSWPAGVHERTFPFSLLLRCSAAFELCANKLV